VLEVIETVKRVYGVDFAVGLADSHGNPHPTAGLIAGRPSLKNPVDGYIMAAA
jgi:hypothetical protein